ncbi:MAG: DUF4041 domain-containing protein [Fusobacteriaceae bacterium]
MTLILLVLLILLLILIFKKEKKNTLLQSEKNESLLKAIDSENENNKLKLENLNIKMRIEELKIYEEMKMTKDKAQKEADLLLEQCHKIIEENQNKSSSILSNAKQKARESNQKSEEIIDKALKKAHEVEENAKNKAKEISGTAYQIKENAVFYESVALAMKNKIVGYGDNYLKPTHSLIDDLANEYNFLDIGKQLKEERELIKRMIVNEMASSCDYAQATRSKTACEFVLDAFNGKVESILSRVKFDNYGKLEQEIKDAYILVNYNGVAFRNAKIEEKYLEVRLKELELLVKLYLYKEQEKEEQKIIREQIREEEKAKREYEKAIKESEAEEKRNQKALDQARKEYEKIMETKSEEEKAKFALKIQELERQLEEASKNKEKAISQAQLTKSGHVYIISNIGSFGENVYKIGMTRRLDPLDRVKELSGASVPFPFDIHAMIYSKDAPGVENKIHKEFNDKSTNLVNLRKEFFTINLEEVEAFVKENCGEFKLTKFALAAQYRESLKMKEKNIKPIYEENDTHEESEDLL